MSVRTSAVRVCSMYLFSIRERGCPAEPSKQKGNAPQLAIQTVVPAPLQKTLLRDYHDRPHAGHMGARKTLNQILTKYWWKGKSVKSHVKSCRSCQLCETDYKKTSGYMQTNTIDLPLPEEQSSRLQQDIFMSSCANIEQLVEFSAFSHHNSLQNRQQMSLLTRSPPSLIDPHERTAPRLFDCPRTGR